MKSKLIYLLLLLFPLVALAQKEPRELLRGRVAADSATVDNVSVKNISSNIIAVTDSKGNFTIYARPTDTLHISSITYRDVALVLKREHFALERLVIRLDVNVTELEEVRISQLTGDLARDSRGTIKTLSPQLNSAEIVKGKIDEYKYSEETTAGMDPVGKNMHGLNVGNLLKLVFKPKKKTETKNPYAHLNFSEEVKDRFTYHFFTETLNIPKDEIGLFLNYCDTGPGITLLLDPQKEFELTDYLVSKSIAYRKLKN